MRKTWNNLSMADKTKYIQDMVRQGISTLDEISAQYNAFAGGGTVDDEDPNSGPLYIADKRGDNALGYRYDGSPMDVVVTAKKPEIWKYVFDPQHGARIYGVYTDKYYDTKEDAEIDYMAIKKLENSSASFFTQGPYIHGDVILPFDENKRVVLTNAGRATGAILSTNMLDSLAKYAEMEGLDPWEFIAVDTKESTLGNPTDNQDTYNLFSKATKDIVGRYPTEQHLNTNGHDVSARESLNFWEADSNPYESLLAESSKKAHNDAEFYENLRKGMAYDDRRWYNTDENMNVLQAAARYYKNNPDKYNPAQKGYRQLVHTIANELQQSPEMQEWWKSYQNMKMGYPDISKNIIDTNSYAEGGPLTNIHEVEDILDSLESEKYADLKKYVEQKLGRYADISDIQNLKDPIYIPYDLGTGIFGYGDDFGTAIRSLVVTPTSHEEDKFAQFETSDIEDPNNHYTNSEKYQFDSRPLRYNGGTKEQTRKRFWKDRPLVTKTVSDIAKLYGINENLLKYRLEHEGFVDANIDETNSFFLNNHIEPLKELFGYRPSNYIFHVPTDEDILGSPGGGYTKFGLDNVADYIDNGQIKLLNNEQWDLFETINEKGQPVNAASGKTAKDNIGIQAATLKFLREQAKKDFPKASDKDLDRYAAAYFNRGITGGRTWVRRGAKGYNIKADGGNLYAKGGPLGNVYDGTGDEPNYLLATEETPDATAVRGYQDMLKSAEANNEAWKQWARENYMVNPITGNILNYQIPNIDIVAPYKGNNQEYLAILNDPTATKDEKLAATINLKNREDALQHGINSTVNTVAKEILDKGLLAASFVNPAIGTGYMAGMTGIGAYDMYQNGINSDNALQVGLGLLPVAGPIKNTLNTAARTSKNAYTLGKFGWNVLRNYKQGQGLENILNQLDKNPEILDMFPKGMTKRAFETVARTDGMGTFPKQEIEEGLSYMSSNDKQRLWDIGKYIVLGKKSGPKGRYNSFRKNYEDFYTGSPLFVGPGGTGNDIIDAYFYNKEIDPSWGFVKTSVGSDFGEHASYIKENYASKVKDIPVYRSVGNTNPIPESDISFINWRSSEGDIYGGPSTQFSPIDAQGHRLGIGVTQSGEPVMNRQDIWKFLFKDYNDKYSGFIGDYPNLYKKGLDIMNEIGTPVITRTGWMPTKTYRSWREGTDWIENTGKTEPEIKVTSNFDINKLVSDITFDRDKIAMKALEDVLNNEKASNVKLLRGNLFPDGGVINGGRMKVEGQPVEFSVTAPYTQPYTYYSPWDKQWYGIGYGGAQVPVDNPGKYSLSLDDYMKLKQERAKSDDVGGWHQLGDLVQELGWALVTAPMFEGTEGASWLKGLTKKGRNAIKMDLGIADKKTMMDYIINNMTHDQFREWMYTGHFPTGSSPELQRILAAFEMSSGLDKNKALKYAYDALDFQSAPNWILRNADHSLTDGEIQNLFDQYEQRMQKAQKGARYLDKSVYDIKNALEGKENGTPFNANSMQNSNTLGSYSPYYDNIILTPHKEIESTAIHETRHALEDLIGIPRETPFDTYFWKYGDDEAAAVRAELIDQILLDKGLDNPILDKQLKAIEELQPQEWYSLLKKQNNGYIEDYLYKLEQDIKSGGLSRLFKDPLDYFQNTTEWKEGLLNGWRNGGSLHSKHSLKYNSYDQGGNLFPEGGVLQGEYDANGNLNFLYPTLDDVVINASQPYEEEPQLYVARYDENGNPVYTVDKNLSMGYTTTPMTDREKELKDARIDIKNRRAGKLGDYAGALANMAELGISASLAPLVGSHFIPALYEGLGEIGSALRPGSPLWMNPITKELITGAMAADAINHGIRYASDNQYNGVGDYLVSKVDDFTNTVDRYLPTNIGTHLRGNPVAEFVGEAFNPGFRLGSVFGNTFDWAGNTLFNGENAARNKLLTALSKKIDKAVDKGITDTRFNSKPQPRENIKNRIAPPSITSVQNGNLTDAMKEHNADVLYSYMVDGNTAESIYGDGMENFANWTRTVDHGVKGGAKAIMEKQVRPRFIEQLKESVKNGEINELQEGIYKNWFDDVLRKAQVVTMNQEAWKDFQRLTGKSTTFGFYQPGTNTLVIPEKANARQIAHEIRHALQDWFDTDIVKLETKAEDAFSPKWWSTYEYEKAPSIIELRDAILEKKAGSKDGKLFDHNNLSIEEQNKIIDELSDDELVDILLNDGNGYIEQYMHNYTEDPLIKSATTSPEAFREQLQKIYQDYKKMGLSDENAQDWVNYEVNPLYDLKKALKYGWGIIPAVGAVYGAQQDDQKTVDGNQYAKGGYMNFYEGMPDNDSEDMEALNLIYALTKAKRQQMPFTQMPEIPKTEEPVKEQPQVVQDGPIYGYTSKYKDVTPAQYMQNQQEPINFEDTEQTGDRYDNLKDFLRWQESFKESVYYDSNGKPTIGYGFNGEYPGSKKPVKPTDKITRDEAEKYLDIAIREKANYLSKRLPNWDKLSPNQQDALIDIAFNAGNGARHFSPTSQLYKALQRMDLEGVANNLSTRSSDPQYRQVLINRSKARNRMFREGVYGNKPKSGREKAQDFALNYFASKNTTQPQQVRRPVIVTRDYVEETLGI